MRCATRAPILLAAVIGLPAPQAAAQTIRGAGARPCTDWVQARTGNGHNYEAEQWALGYLSGVNAGTRSQTVFRNADEKTIFGELDVYCGAHRDSSLWDAVRSILTMQRGA